MKINEVIEAVLKEKHRFTQDTGNTPFMAIYMTDSFYHECTADIIGSVDSYSHSLAMNRSLMGYPVNIILNSSMDHPPFRVFAIPTS